jgi:hypothetical protein
MRRSAPIVSAMFRAGLLLAFAAGSAETARADAYCSGTVQQYYVQYDGMLVIRSSWRNDWTALCSVQTPWRNVSTEACYTWVGTVTTAKVNNKTVGAYYVGSYDCTTLATYESAPAPLYFRME